jgi:hypothetical protein
MQYKRKGTPGGKGGARKRAQRTNGSPEHDIQVCVVDYLDAMEVPPLYSATVGGVRVAMQTALRMKRAGYRKGIPDLLIFEPRNGYSGLALEIKTSVGRASTHQEEWIKKLNERGWKAVIVKGYEACIEAIDTYFT